MDIIDPRVEEYAERFTTPHEALLADPPRDYLKAAVYP